MRCRIPSLFLFLVALAHWEVDGFDGFAVAAGNDADLAAGHESAVLHFLFGDAAAWAEELGVVANREFKVAAVFGPDRERLLVNAHRCELAFDFLAVFFRSDRRCLLGKLLGDLLLSGLFFLILDGRSSHEP